MKPIGLFLLVAWFMSWADTASSDPLSVGSAIGFALFNLGAPTALLTATSLTFLGTATIVGTGLAVARALLPGQPASNPTVYKQPTQIVGGPKVYAFGRVKIGTRFFFKDSAGFEIYRGVLLSEGPIDYFEEFFIGDREVIIDAVSGAVKSFPWSQPSADYASITTKVGDGTEAGYTPLVLDFDRWTADHDVKGVAQTLVNLTSPGVSSSLFSRLFGDNSVRDKHSYVIRARTIYDPRKDSTVSGGSGTHRADTVSTWEWSENGVLIAAHVLYRLWPEFSSSDMDWEDIIVEAGKADTLVEGKYTFEKRSRVWGAFETEGASRWDILQSILTSAGAYIYENTDTGKYSIRLDEDNPPSEITFTADDIISYELQTPEGPERNNSVQLEYYSPELDYSLGQILLRDGGAAIGWSQYSTEIALNGEQPHQIGLDFCPGASQAQQIARRLFERDRQARGVVKLNLAGAAAWGKRIMTLDIPELGQIKCRIVGRPRIGELGDSTVEITFVEEPTLSAWDPDNDEADPPTQLPSLTTEGDLATPAAPTAAIVVEYPDNTFELRCQFNAVGTGVATAEAIYRFFDGSDLPQAYNAMTEIGLTFAWAALASDETGTKAEFRVRTVNGAGDEGSDYSAAYSVPSLGTFNGTPSAPGISGDWEDDPYTMTVTSPSDYHVVAIEIEDEQNTGNNTTANSRPGDTNQVTGNRSTTPGTYKFRARSITSDGTVSAWAEVSTTVTT